jgi:hypothetical protein
MLFELTSHCLYTPVVFQPPLSLELKAPIHPLTFLIAWGYIGMPRCPQGLLSRFLLAFALF